MFIHTRRTYSPLPSFCAFPFPSCLQNQPLPQNRSFQVMVGADVHVPEVPSLDLVGVKVPQFSFNRLPSADPTLGVDMISTGEVACFGKTREEAYMKAMVATSFLLPPAKGNVLLSIGGYEGKKEFLPSATVLQGLGFKLFGSMGAYGGGGCGSSALSRRDATECSAVHCIQHCILARGPKDG